MYRQVGQPDWAPKWGRKMGGGNCPFVSPPNVGKVRLGKHRRVKSSAYNQAQMQRGIQVQMEHTDEPAIARQIAKDHLAEIPDYYTRLDKMQAQAVGQTPTNSPEAAQYAKSLMYSPWFYLPAGLGAISGFVQGMHVANTQQGDFPALFPLVVLSGLGIGSGTISGLILSALATKFNWPGA